MGGPIGVKDIGNERYTWLKLEKKFIKKKLENKRPIIGVYLGAQLLASAPGGDKEFKIVISSKSITRNWMVSNFY